MAALAQMQAIADPMAHWFARIPSCSAGARNDGGVHQRGISVIAGRYGRPRPTTAAKFVPKSFSGNVMASDEKDPRYQTAREFAGPHYEDMMRSKGAALGYLSARDDRVRLAAILVCKTTWNCAGDSEVMDACRSIASSRAEEFVRICAIDLYSIALTSTGDADASRFLANLVLDSANSNEVKRGAYFALRMVQHGIGDSGFDSLLKGIVYKVRTYMRAHPGQFLEESVKAELVPPEGNFPEGFWDKAEDIDWDFVRRFAG